MTGHHQEAGEKSAYRKRKLFYIIVSFMESKMMSLAGLKLQKEHRTLA
jgi:hypothetical protein